jgi:hypothetical protein
LAFYFHISLIIIYSAANTENILWTDDGQKGGSTSALAVLFFIHSRDTVNCLGDTNGTDVLHSRDIVNCLGDTNDTNVRLLQVPLTLMNTCTK